MNQSKLKDKVDYPPEAYFLKELFKELNESSIKYCVLRNHEGLPYDLRGHDLDLLVEKKAIKHASSLITQIAKKTNGFAVWRDWNDYMRLFHCSGKINNQKRWGVHIDILTAIRWHGCDYYSSKQVLSRAKVVNGIFVAEDADSKIIAFLDKLFIKGFASYLYASRAFEGFPRLNRDAKKELREKIGNKIEFLQNPPEMLNIFERQDYKNMKKLANKLRKNLQINSLLKFPFKVIRNKSKRFLFHIQRIAYRPGIMIAVIGCDGSGKSTLIDIVSEEIYKLIHMKPIKEFHRPNFLPRLAILLGKYTGPVLNYNPEPHSRPPSRLIGSILRLLYYSIDYILGFWVKVYPKLVKPPMIFFFDRYFYDYYVDPERWRVTKQYWLLNILKIFIPQPDLTIMLFAKPDELISRKKELPIQELKRQIHIMKSFSKRIDNSVTIDTSGDIKIASNKIVEVVLKTFKRRPGWKFD